MDAQELKAALTKAANEFWNSNQKPLLLSNLPPLLTKSGLGDYKSALNGISLKSFVISIAGADTFEVVTHPKHYAKIGLIPPGNTYAFTDSQNPTSSSQVSKGPSQAKALLDILSGLTAEDLEKVVIPASVLVKLHKKS